MATAGVDFTRGGTGNQPFWASLQEDLDRVTRTGALRGTSLESTAGSADIWSGSTNTPKMAAVKMIKCHDFCEQYGHTEPIFGQIKRDAVTFNQRNVLDGDADLK